MIKAGIIGGSEYSAGELIRLLINHPDVEIIWVNSSEHAPKKVESIHQGLTGELSNLRFREDAPLDNVDVVFFCTPRGETRAWMEQNYETLPESLKIIDLSGDYRIDYSDMGFVYGLPELNRKPMVRGATRVATPGCFAMAIELALLPLAKNGLLGKELHITGITGTSGAGVTPQPITHFTWRNDNVAVFKPFSHQHLAEIKEMLKVMQPGYEGELNFIPMRGGFSRGILVSIYFNTELDVEEVKEMYEDYYDDHNFTFITDRMPDLKDVVNTNKCLLNIQKVGNKMLITSVIDNMLKGSSGNAVHVMNLLFGLHERTGLSLKASAY